jgi:hypothetical protein
MANLALKNNIYYSGMWASSFFCGSFAGPTLGGIMVEQLGFPITTVWFSSFLCLTMLADVYELVSSQKNINYKLLK